MAREDKEWRESVTAGTATPGEDTPPAVTEPADLGSMINIGTDENPRRTFVAPPLEGTERKSSKAVIAFEVGEIEHGIGGEMVAVPKDAERMTERELRKEER